MFQRRVFLVALICLIAAASITEGRSRRSRSSSRGSGEPGVFDLYLLSLSWSPQHCAGPSGARDSLQCGSGRRYGFVVHGLWPQYDRGGWPEDCGDGGEVSPASIQRVLAIMPSEGLIRHEWSKHGTCSGLPQQKYFETIQNAFAAVRIPNEYRQPVQQVNIDPSEMKHKFVAANSGWSAGGVRIQCSGRFLSEVRICFTKDLKPRACPASVRDGCPSEATLRPVR